MVPEKNLRQSNTFSHTQSAVPEKKCTECGARKKMGTVWASRLGTVSAAAKIFCSTCLQSFWFFRFPALPTSGGRRISLSNCSDAQSCHTNLRSSVFRIGLHGHRMVVESCSDPGTTGLLCSRRRRPPPQSSPSENQTKQNFGQGNDKNWASLGRAVLAVPPLERKNGNDI